MISQNIFKSNNTPQPTQSIAATFSNEDGDDITVTVDEMTIEWYVIYRSVLGVKF